MSDDEIKDRVARFVAHKTGAQNARVVEMTRLSGGAIQENVAVELELTGGTLPGRQSLVLRMDSESGVAVSLSRAEEFAVLKMAHEAGVTVPEPLWLGDDEAAIGGRPFYFMRRACGSASGRELVRSDFDESTRERLVYRLAREMATLHKVRPPLAELAFLAVPQPTSAQRRIDDYRRYLDAMPTAQPILEWGLTWLERNAPRNTRVTLTHGDCRTGNYLVHEGKLTAILDWEFAAWSDPMEDLGWFCAHCWRFGAWDREAGGLGSRAALYAGYESVNGGPVDADVVPYWEVMATMRWAIIALQQAERHLSGEQPSLELALTGRLVPELAFDLLTQINRIEGVA